MSEDIVSRTPSGLQDRGLLRRQTVSGVHRILSNLNTVRPRTTRISGIGTLHELTVAYEIKPTVILEGTGDWSDRLREIAYEGKYLEQGGIAELHYAKTPREAVDLAFSLASPGERGRDLEREYR